MIEINPSELPMRDDSPPRVMLHAANRMINSHQAWLNKLGELMAAHARNAESAGVTIDLTAAYAACDEPAAIRGMYHVARDYLAHVARCAGGEASC